MQNWRSLLTNALLPATQHDSFWNEYLDQFILQEETPHSIHLAIFVEPYLQFILEGLKTVESRFSIRRCAPYNCVDRGDMILLKRAGGPIVGLCHVASAWFYKLEKNSWREIKQTYAAELCAQDPEFWRERQGASYATLMRIGRVLPIEPIVIEKRDRRGWVVLHSTSRQLELRMEEV